jgi:hypothetical protein
LVAAILRRALLLPRAACLPAPRSPRHLVAGSVVIAIALAAPAFAEDPPHRVGSLNYISGEVNYALRPESGEPGVLSWSTADFNQPVCQDMSLQTGPLARARIRIGPNAIQMSSDTSLDMLNLNDGLIEVSVPQGRIHLQLRDLGDGESVEIEIPRGSLWLLQPGAYDIQTPPAADQPARITVFEGKARFVGGTADVPVEAGEELRVTGMYPAVVTTRSVAIGPSATSANTEPVTAGAPAKADLEHAAPGPEPPHGSAAAHDSASPTRNDDRPLQPLTSDDFLSWVSTSETDVSAAPAAQYASPEMAGYQELAQYGQWTSLDDYGPVWIPAAVPPEWAPYRYGHWTSIPPWGWTWIDDQPWGFAPFHYGRWVNVDGRWGWVPGEPADHPVYAPALVAFLGTSEDASGAAAGEAPVGWFPLAPGDAYTPWFVAGPAYVKAVDVVYPRRFHEDPLRWRGGRGREIWRGDFANRRFASFVQRDVFAQGRPVGREMMRMSPDRLERAAVMRGAPHIIPAAMRTMAGPGALRGEPHGIAPAMAGAGALRAEPHGVGPVIAGPGGVRAEPHMVHPGMAGPGGGLRGEPRVVGPVMAGPGRLPSEPHGFASVPPHGMMPGAARNFAGPGAPVAGMQNWGGGRPQVFQTPAPTYRPGVQQFGRPQVAMPTQMMGRGVSPAMMGRGMPQVAARPQVQGGGGGAPHKK